MLCHFLKVHTACYSTLYLKVALGRNLVYSNLTIARALAVFHRVYVEVQRFFCTYAYFFVSVPTQQYILVVDLR